MAHAPADPSLPRQSRVLWRVTPPFVRGVGRIFYRFRVERHGPTPDPPFVVSANHYSHFDPPLIAAALDMPVRFLALEDLFGANRLFDWLITGFGAIPIPRHRPPVRALRAALGRLDAGEVVGVFPEATRVTKWGTKPPKHGAAWLSMRSGVPLVPVSVIGTGRAFDLDNRLHRASIKIVVGQAMYPGDGDYRSLTAHWAEWIAGQVARHPSSEADGPPRAAYS